MSERSEVNRYILILDDLKAVCLWAAAALKPCGLPVRTSQTLEQAAMIVKSCGMPAVAVLDVQLAGEKGIEAMKLLTNDVPVVIFSASCDDAHMPEGRSVYRLCKPAAPQRLRELISSLAKLEEPQEPENHFIFMRIRARQSFLQHVSELVRSVQAGEQVDLAPTIHRLKGTCAIFGFTDVQQQLAELEQRLKQRDVAIAADTSDVIKDLLICLYMLPIDDHAHDAQLTG